MTDTPVTDAPVEDAPVEPEADPKGPLPDDPAVLRAELEKVRREAAKYRTENRDLKPLADKARDMEEANKTELQKLTDQSSKDKADATAARDELARIRVAISKGLPLELASRLQGADETEMNEDADRLLEVMKPATPQGSADGGARGTQPQGQLTRDALKTMTPEQIVEAKAKGLLNDVLGIT